MSPFRRQEVGHLKLLTRNHTRNWYVSQTSWRCMIKITGPTRSETKLLWFSKIDRKQICCDSCPVIPHPFLHMFWDLGIKNNCLWDWCISKNIDMDFDFGITERPMILWESQQIYIPRNQGNFHTNDSHIHSSPTSDSTISVACLLGISFCNSVSGTVCSMFSM